MEGSQQEQKPLSSEEAAEQVLKIDEVVESEIVRITEFGAFVKFTNGKKGLIHISQVADSYVKNINDHLKIGDKVKARIIKISPDGKIDLTLKTQRETAPRPKGRHQNFGGGRRENMTSYPNGKAFRTSSFEEKLKHFLKDSEERQADLKKHYEEKQGR